MPPHSVLTPVVTFAATATLGLGSYLRYQHQSLRSKVKSKTISAVERTQTVASKDLESLPQDLLDRPEAYRIIHEQDTVPLSPSVAPFFDDVPEAEALFTLLMRRNMLIFATYLPQSYLMRLLAKTPEQKRSFSTTHINSLTFTPADIVCGFYGIIVRRPLKCEMGMAAPAAGLPESFGGRLVTSIVSSDEGAGMLLRTETLQWVRKEETMVLPLERGTMRILHEFASWSLLVTGAKWLESEVAKSRAKPGGRL